VGGGTVFGPKPRSYYIPVPKKVRRGALRSVLSLRGREEKLLIVDTFKLPEIKTKNLVQVLTKLGAEKALIVEHQDNLNLVLSARNLPRCKVLPPEGLNVYDVLKHEQLILTTETARDVERRLTA
jgi:large subunit ribosomal protein L4